MWRKTLPLNRDLHLNVVPSVPRASRTGVLHVWTVLPFARETLWIGQTIPRFAADEGRRLVGRRPHQPSRSGGYHAGKALFLVVEHVNRCHLVLVEDQSLMGKGFDGEGHERIEVVIARQGA